MLRYWEQEFTQLRPVKRRGNRRYYQHHEVLLIRKIRDLLHEQGFTIVGARTKLQEVPQVEQEESLIHEGTAAEKADSSAAEVSGNGLQVMRRELLEIRDLLGDTCTNASNGGL